MSQESPCGIAASTAPDSEGGHMLWTLVLILIVLWALGLVGGYAFGGLIHLLLVVAIVVVIIQVIQGRKVL